MKKLILFFIIAISTISFGQIDLEITSINSTIYTDDSILLDINVDGIDDIIIRLSPVQIYMGDTTRKSTIDCINSNFTIACNQTSWGTYPAKFLEEDTINSGLLYYSNYPYTFLLHTCGVVGDIPGYFIENNGGVINDLFNAFIGIRFQIGSDYHYGWINIDKCKYDSWLTVQAVAYNPEPNMPTKCTPANSHIDEIEIDQSQSFKVYDIMGRPISAKDRESLNTGLYIINGKKEYIIN